MLTALFCGVVARAHQPGLSTLFLDAGTNRITAQIIVAWQELEPTFPLDSNADKALSAEELAAAKARLLRLAEGALSLESDGRMLSLKAPPEVATDDTTGIRFQLTYELPSTQVLLVTSEILGELQAGHSQVVLVRNASGAKIGETILDRDKMSVEIPLGITAQEQQPVSAAREFFALGVEHIVMGWDHLAFLFGLLIVGGKLRDAVKIITSFTIAHSLTLALATFNLITVSPRIVEPLIAASIIYVGFENIVREDFSKRWMLTFAFGLVHGCGFATILRDRGIGADGEGVAAPLVWFNVGVEVGQIAIAALLLPVIWKMKPTFPKRWVPATSVALIVLGSYFLVQRVWA